MDYWLQQKIICELELAAFDRLPPPWQSLVRDSKIEFLATDAEQFIAVFGPTLGLSHARRAIDKAARA